MDKKIFFMVEKNRLMSLRQYEAKLHRLSPVRRLLNQFNYDANMGYAKSKIWRALEKGLPVCFIEYHKIKPNEVKDVIARLNYIGYKVYSINIPYGTSLTASFWVRLDNNEKGIDYVFD